MTLKDFCSLPNYEKADQLYEQGTYIGKRRVNGLVILLYQLEGFYVELSYRRYRVKIASICCFSGTARLDPYLETMDVEHLVE